MSFVFFLNKNINFCCPFCCGFDSFEKIQFKVENENNENENNENEKNENEIDSKKKEIFKKYELAEGKNNEYEENKKQLFSLGDETFWKYFFGKLAVDLILKKEKEIKEKDKKDKDEKEKDEKEKDIKYIKEKKEVINFIFEKYARDAFVDFFFKEKNKDDIKSDNKKSIFDVSLDDIIFFAFLFIENVYLNETNTVPGSLNVRKYFALKNLCTFYFNPKDEIIKKYTENKSFNPEHIIQFFNNYIETIRANEEMCINILKYFNTICVYKRSCLMSLFMHEENLVEHLFICTDLKNSIIDKYDKNGNKNSIIDNYDNNGNNIDLKSFYETFNGKFLGRFNNESFKINNGDFNEKFKKIVFEEDFLKDLWNLYGQEVINSILETNNTNATNKNNLKIEEKMEKPSVENNDEKAKNKSIPQDEILNFEKLKIYVGDKPEENSFLNGFLIGLLNYRTDLVNIFKEKIKINGGDERSWKDWLSEQSNSLGNNEINFNDGFSELTDSKGAFDKNLTPVDKYFCGMLLFLFKILSEENYNIINEDFSNLKKLTKQFFHVKKILNKVKGVFNVSAPKFYETLFSFMELMYQKFLGDEGICKKKGYEIEDSVDINVNIKNIINDEKNLIRLFFGFYYIKPGKNKNFFLKHLYCWELDNKKNVSLASLDNLYSKKKYSVVSFCPNLIVPIQIYSGNDISSNHKIKINNCEYRFKMILNPGYDSSMINENQKDIENNGCSFYMLDDLSGKNINFVYSKILTKNGLSVDKFITQKNVKEILKKKNNILQKKYVTYFFVKRFDKEESDDAFCKKNIPFENKIQNNRTSLIKINPEKLKTTNNNKENKEENKKENKEENKKENEKVSPDKKKDIEQKLKKIRDFYSGSKGNDKNCSDPFILPTYKVEGNIFDKINDWKEFMNIIKNNGAILPEEKKDENEINTNENNLNENEINTNLSNLINAENHINPSIDDIKEYINECFNDYYAEINVLKLDNQNIVYSLLNLTNILYKKLLKIINGNIEYKKILCSIIFKEINNITEFARPLEFEYFESFRAEFENANLGDDVEHESNVVESFYEKWKNFMDRFPFLIQNSLLLYGVSLVLNNISDEKNAKDGNNVKDLKNDINQQMTFSTKLLKVKILLSSNLLDDNKEVHKNLIFQFLPNQNIEKKNSINKNELFLSLKNFLKEIEFLRKKFEFKKENITKVLDALKKYNKKYEKEVNIVENEKKQELEQLEKKIEGVKKVVEKYLTFWEKNFKNEGKGNKKKNGNENPLVAFFYNKYFVECFEENDEFERVYLVCVELKIKEFDEDIKKIKSEINNLLSGKNTKDIMGKTFALFTYSQNNNGLNKNDNDNVFKKTYEKFLGYYNELSKSYEEEKNKEKKEEDEEKNEEEENKEEEKKNEENKEENKEEEEKIGLFKQKMTEILLDYILKSDIAGGIEKKLDEQIKNNWENNEEYFKDLLFGLHNWRDNCFLNSSIQLLLRCWDSFEEISKQKNGNNEEFFTWLKNWVETIFGENNKNIEALEGQEISLKFIYEFFKFGKMVNEEKENIRKENNKITKEKANAVHNKMLKQHENLVKLWRLYGIKVEHEPGFANQADSYDALNFFFNCLKSVMFIFDNKQKSISSFIFSCGTGENSKNVKITLSCENTVDDISCDLNIQKIEDLWEKNVLKNALLDKMPLYYKLFGNWQGGVKMCTNCNFFYCNSTISCIDNVHIDDFVCGKDDKNVGAGYICPTCNKEENIISFKFLVPIGKYFFWGNADAASIDDSDRKTWATKMKYLESWKDRIDDFGEGNHYRNIGVGMHSGSVGENSCGHYWAYIRSRYLNNLYLDCNDSRFPYDHPVVCGDTSNSNHERVYLFEKIEKLIK